MKKYQFYSSYMQLQEEKGENDMKKHFIKCRTVLGIVMIVSIILFPINAYGGQSEEIEALQAEQNAHNEAIAEENRKEVEAAAAEKVAAQMAAIEEAKAAAILAQEQNEAIAAANREAVEAAAAEKVAAQMAAIEGTDFYEEAVEEKHSENQADEKKGEVFIEELIESANIEGTYWLDWSVEKREELKDYYPRNEYDTDRDENTVLSVIDQDGDIYIADFDENDADINDCGTTVAWNVSEEDNRILNYINSWGSQSYLQGDKDYSDGSGFLGYMYEKKCASIEDLLTLWNMEKADPKFLEAYEAGEDYSTTLLTEYGETGFHMSFDEVGIGLVIEFPRENDEGDEEKVPDGILMIMEQEKGKDKEFSICLMMLSAQ